MEQQPSRPTPAPSAMTELLAYFHPLFTAFGIGLTVFFGLVGLVEVVVLVIDTLGRR